jgi:hypothetical protein
MMEDDNDASEVPFLSHYYSTTPSHSHDSNCKTRFITSCRHGSFETSSLVINLFLLEKNTICLFSVTHNAEQIKVLLYSRTPVNEIPNRFPEQRAI